jgi:hypothetical protein
VSVPHKPEITLLQKEEDIIEKLGSLYERGKPGVGEEEDILNKYDALYERGKPAIEIPHKPVVESEEKPTLTLVPKEEEIVAPTPYDRAFAGQVQNIPTPDLELVPKEEDAKPMTAYDKAVQAQIPGVQVEKEIIKEKVETRDFHEITGEMATARTWEELLEAIGQQKEPIVGSLEAGAQTYTPERLIEIVTAVREGKKTIDRVTRSAGLRDTVERLLSADLLAAAGELGQVADKEVTEDILSAAIDAEKEGGEIIKQVSEEAVPIVPVAGEAIVDPAESGKSANAAEEKKVEANSPSKEDQEKALAKELVEKFEKMNPQERFNASLRIQNLGFQVEKYKNMTFGGVFSKVGAMAETESTSGKFMQVMGEMFKAKADRNNRTIQALEKLKTEKKGSSIFTKFSNMSLLTGNAIKAVRIGTAAGFPVITTAMMGAMAAGTVLEAGKETRLRNQEVINKTRISDENLSDEEQLNSWDAYVKLHPDAPTLVGKEREEAIEKAHEQFALAKAQDEAIELMNAALRNNGIAIDQKTPEEIAKMSEKDQVTYNAKMRAGAEIVSAKDLERAYETRIAKNLEERLDRYDELREEESLTSKFTTSLTSKYLHWAVESTQKKMNAIEVDSTMTAGQKKTKQEEIMNRFGRSQMLKDIDRMLSQQGTLDKTALWLRRGEKMSKAVFVGIALESLHESIPRLYDIVHRGAGELSAVLGGGVAAIEGKSKTVLSALGEYLQGGGERPQAPSSSPFEEKVAASKPDVPAPVRESAPAQVHTAPTQGKGVEGVEEMLSGGKGKPTSGAAAPQEITKSLEDEEDPDPNYSDENSDADPEERPADMKKSVKPEPVRIPAPPVHEMPLQHHEVEIHDPFVRQFEGDPKMQQLLTMQDGQARNFERQWENNFRVLEKSRQDQINTYIRNRELTHQAYTQGAISRGISMLPNVMMGNARGMGGIMAQDAAMQTQQHMNTEMQFQNQMRQVEQTFADRVAQMQRQYSDAKIGLGNQFATQQYRVAEQIQNSQRR